jgi:uncharacterized membrane protein
MKRKIVLKRNSTNTTLVAIVWCVILVIVAFPIISYLLDIGVKPSYSSLVGIWLGWLTGWAVVNLTVEFEPKPFDISKGLFVTSLLGLLAICVAANMRQIFLACAVALLIIGLWAWEIHNYRSARASYEDTHSDH